MASGKAAAVQPHVDGANRKFRKALYFLRTSARESVLQMSIYNKDDQVLDTSCRMLNAWVDREARACAAKSKTPALICTNCNLIYTGLIGRTNAVLRFMDQTTVKDAKCLVQDNNAAALFIFRRDVVRNHGETKTDAPAKEAFADLAEGEQPFILVTPQ